MPSIGAKPAQTHPKRLVAVYSPDEAKGAADSLCPGTKNR